MLHALALMLDAVAAVMLHAVALTRHAVAAMLHGVAVTREALSCSDARSSLSMLFPSSLSCIVQAGVRLQGLLDVSHGMSRCKVSYMCHDMSHCMCHM